MRVDGDLQSGEAADWSAVASLPQVSLCVLQVLALAPPAWSTGSLHLLLAQPPLWRTRCMAAMGQRWDLGAEL